MSIQWKLPLILLLSMPLYLQANVFDEFRTDTQNSFEEKDLEKWEKRIENLTPGEKSLMHFALGLGYSELEKAEKAEEHLAESIRLGSNLDQIASYKLGQSYVKTNKLEAAKIHLGKVIRKKSYLKQRAQFELATVYMKQKKFSLAKRLYAYLERRMRRENEYPDILWGLASIELENKRPYRACRWVKKLYSREPGYEKIAHWSLDPASIKMNDKEVNCEIHITQKKNRIRNLRLTGNSERAKQEVDSYVEKYKDIAKYESHILSAYYLIQEGYPKEAFQILVPDYLNNENNYDYLLLFAKASIQAGKFQTAVGAYYKAYQLRRRTRSGRYSLYQAAFLSYQFQDYDGAGRKFEEFIEKYPRSGLAKHSYWHLAWLKYLKKDYKGALKAFNKLKRYRHLARQDRTIYWKAMTYYHLADYQSARNLFNMLVDKENPTYYGITAMARLSIIPEIESPRKLANAEVEESIENEKGNENISEAEESEENVANIEQVAEQENEEKEEEVADIDINVTEGIAVLKPTEAEEDSRQDLLLSREFTSSTANQAYRRAMDLIRLGFYDWARWELFTVEKYSKTFKERKKLIAIYEEIHAYHRSLHIATHRFIKERRKQGLKSRGDLWLGAYPRAYKEIVEESSIEKDISPYFIWSIVRAESQFRVDAESPVGAQGLMQLMPYTAVKMAKIEKVKEPKIADLITAKTNITLGSAYLSRLYHKFDKQIPLAAAGYNAGPHRVKSWIKNFGHLDYDEFIEHIPFVETRKYVKKVVSYNYIYKHLYSSDRKVVDTAWLGKKIPYQFSGQVPTREIW